MRAARLWRAVDPVPPGLAAGRAAGRLGQPAVLDGPRRGDDRPAPTAAAETFCARRRRSGRRRDCSRSAPGSIPGKCAGSRHARRDARAARTHGVGRRFFLCAAARRRPAAGAAGRRRLQPQIGPRPGVVLLQPALVQGDRPHRHRRQAGRSHRPCLDGPGMEQPAARPGPDRLGLVLAAPRRPAKN